ncbi:adrenodoxin-like [Arapaima gigas]
MAGLASICSPISLVRSAAARVRSRTFGRNRAFGSGSQDPSKGDKVVLHFINQNGAKITASVAEGESLLDVVMNKNLDLSGFGACEGTLACSTCHLIFDETVYNKLDPIGDDELDMLDLAYGLTKTSRLGCQVHIQKWMDGMTVKVPREVKDLRSIKESAKNQ